jgi:hypothetical protein
MVKTECPGILPYVVTRRTLTYVVAVNHLASSFSPAINQRQVGHELEAPTTVVKIKPGWQSWPSDNGVDSSMFSSLTAIHWRSFIETKVCHGPPNPNVFSPLSMIMH